MRQHFNQRAFKNDRRLSTPEQSGNELKTQGSLKTRGGFHKKYCSALRKHHLCKPTILDEFPEFDRRVIESLRQPLEEQTVSIARVRASLVFPADFILVAAMNPCPCGNYGHPRKACMCSAHERIRYARKVSGPIIDRIDIFLSVGPVEYEKLGEKRAGVHASDTADVCSRVCRARVVQKARAGVLNSRMRLYDIEHTAPLDDDVREVLQDAARTYDLSARAYHKIIKLARTIADLDNARDIAAGHIMEALSYRQKSDET